MQKSQVDKVEHMKTMFLDILAMCEEFETRVTLLETKTKEVQEESTSAKAERSNIWTAMSKMKNNKDAIEPNADMTDKIVQLEAKAMLSYNCLLDVKNENTKIWHALTQNIATDSIQLEATQNLATDTKHLMSAVHARTTKLESQSKSMKERIDKLEGCDNQNGVSTTEQKTTEDDNLAKSVSQLKIEGELKKLEAIPGRLHAPHLGASCPPTSGTGVALHPIQYSGVPIFQGSYPHGQMPQLPLYPLSFMMPQPTLPLPPHPPYTSAQHQASSPGLSPAHQSAAPGAFRRASASSTEVSPPSTTSPHGPAPPEATSVDVLRPQEYRCSSPGSCRCSWTPPQAGGRQGGGDHQLDQAA